MLKEENVISINQILALEGKRCIFNEGRTCFIAKVKSFKQTESTISCTLSKVKGKEFRISQYVFSEKDCEHSDFEINIDLSVGTSRIGFIKYSENNNYRLVFRFGYFTSRMFFTGKYIEMFKLEDTSWFREMLNEYPL